MCGSPQVPLPAPRRSVTATWSALPALNLWGHAVVHHGDTLYSFGGYGPGPTNAAPARTANIYSLVTTDPSPSWTLLASKLPTPIQGLAACLLDTTPATIAIYGGRASPSNPSTKLFLFSPASLTLSTAAPSNPPPPRYGHTMTALSNRNDMLAVVIGGTTLENPLNTLSILSGPLDNLAWHTRALPHSPFTHHSASLFPTAGDTAEKIVVVGGLMVSRCDWRRLRLFCLRGANSACWTGRLARVPSRSFGAFPAGHLARVCVARTALARGSSTATNSQAARSELTFRPTTRPPILA